MCRIRGLIGLCVVLLGASALSAFAGPMIITTTLKGQEILVDANIKDGDLIQALILLFNQAGFQMRVGPSVSGTIADLQFTQVPFEDAVKKMLSSVDEHYKIEKVDARFYRVDCGDNATVKLPAVKTNSKLATKDELVHVIKVMLPPVKTNNAKDKTSGGVTTGTKTSSTTVTTTDTTSGATGTPAVNAEEAYIGLITVYNMDLGNLCRQLGDIAQYIPPMVSSGYNNGYGNGSSYGYGYGGYNNGYSSGAYGYGYNNGSNGYSNGNGYNNGYYGNGYNNGYGYNNSYNNNQTYPNTGLIR